MEERTVVVSAGIIRKGKKILIAKRKLDDSYEGGQWEFSGGKVKMFEDPKDCLVREVKEELGIDITVGPIFSSYSSTHRKGNIKRHIIVLVYFADWKSGKVKHIECEDTALVSYKDLKKYDFTAADKLVVRDLLSYYCNNGIIKKNGKC